MKSFAFFLTAGAFLVACSSFDNQSTTNSNVGNEKNSTVVETKQTSKPQSEDLTKEQKHILDEKIPPNIRKILDNADEITISYNVDNDSPNLKVLWHKTEPNAEAKISANAKREFLDSFYRDVSYDFDGAACFSPRHRINAKYKSETVEINICYECSNFKGKTSSRDFGGGLAYQSKSSDIIDAIIDKYGVKIN